MAVKNFWILGFLGLGVVLFNYLGFAASVKSVIMIVFGLAIAFFSFKQAIYHKATAALDRSSGEIDKDGINKEETTTTNGL